MVNTLKELKFIIDMVMETQCCLLEGSASLNNYIMAVVMPYAKIHSAARKPD